MAKYSIIDPHVHLWDLRKTPREASLFVKFFGWHRPTMLHLAHKVFPKDVVQFFGRPDHVLSESVPATYLADVANADLAGFVHVEANWKGKGPLGPVAETQWLESLDIPLLKGIVGYADFSLGAKVDEVLRAHVKASSRFRGIRYSLANHPQEQVMNSCGTAELTYNKTWRDGYAKLADHQLSFDATVYHHQLKEITALARDFPEIPIVLCHAGTPIAHGGVYANLGRSSRERAQITQTWQDDMAQLSELSNVSVKISGLAMPILGWGYHRHQTPPAAAEVADHFKPLVDTIIDAFGAERSMYASNFPVDKVSMSWSTLYEAFSMAVADRTDEERRLLFSETAQRIYRL